MHRPRIYAIAMLQQYIQNLREVLSMRGITWPLTDIPFIGVSQRLRTFTVDLITIQYPAPQTASIAMGLFLPIEEIIGAILAEAELRGSPFGNDVLRCLTMLYLHASKLSYDSSCWPMGPAEK